MRTEETRILKVHGYKIRDEEVILSVAMTADVFSPTGIEVKADLIIGNRRVAENLSFGDLNSLRELIEEAWRAVSDSKKRTPFNEQPVEAANGG